MNKVEARLKESKEAKLLSKLKGPKGDKGDKGDIGDKGDKGDPGKNGHTPELDVDYFVISGPRGFPGKNGTDGSFDLGSGDDLFLKLDQSIPQTVINGIPIFDEGWKTNGVNYSSLDNLAAYKIRSSFTAPYSQLSIGVSTTGGYSFIQSNNAAGTTLPIQFWTDATAKLSIAVDGVTTINGDRLEINDGQDNCCIGLNSALNRDAGSGYNTFIGDGVAAHGVMDSASANVGIGYHTLYELTTGDLNVAVGNYSLSNNTTGRENTAVGYMTNPNGGENNTVFGYCAGANIAGDTNLCLGSYAGFRQAAVNNIFLLNNTSGSLANAATELTNSLMYGGFAAVPIDQFLTINAGIFTTIGGQIGNVVTITDTYNVLATDYTVVGNKGTDFTMTLPVAVVGQIYTIKNIGVGIITVDGNDADTIDDELTQTLDQWDAMKIQCYDDNKWVII